jgi:hypothetical protein
MLSVITLNIAKLGGFMPHVELLNVFIPSVVMRNVVTLSVAAPFWKPGANVIKHFTAVIYHHSTVIPSFCVIKLYYVGNYIGMAVNYRSLLTLEKERLELPR